MEDEAQLALHPTLTRLWTKRGWGRQRLIRAPGVNEKGHVFAATSWQEGTLLQRYSERRDSATFCALARECLSRSCEHRRRAIIVVDNLNIHVPERSKKVQQLLADHPDNLELVFLPQYSPDLMPQERLWRVWRGKVTHNHQRTTLAELRADSDTCFAEWANEPATVLRIIGSPFAPVESKTPI